MKIKTIIPVVVLSLAFVSKPIFAKSTIATPSVVRNQVRQEIQEKKQEIKNTLSEAKKQKMQSVYDSIKKGLIERHEALIKIKNKLQARIDKNPMNKDTTKAKAELAKFTAAESQYQTDLTTLNNKFNTLKSSTNPSEIIKGLKDSIKLVRDDLNLIKKVLKASIVALAQAPKLEVTKTK